VGNSKTVDSFFYYGRISGARRRKPGYPLQFLSPMRGMGLAVFPLLSLAQ
jgi:hypothetical protein